jgi:hypothetical protein
VLNVSAEQIPDYDNFLDAMPLPFKLASEIVSLDQAALRPLTQLDSMASLLAEYLNHQAKKIDLLLGFILNQQDHEKNRYIGRQFGGGGVVYQSALSVDIGQFVELKLFFSDQNVAIFCYGEIIESVLDEETGHYLNKAVFVMIRDDDRELLVRTSLHKQSKQLQSLAKDRRRQ